MSLVSRVLQNAGWKKIYLLLTNTLEGSTRKREELFEWKGSAGIRTSAYKFARNAFQLEIRRRTWLSKKCISGVDFQGILLGQKSQLVLMQKWGSSLPQIPQTAGDWTVWSRRSLLVPLFQSPHVPILFNNLQFHTHGVQLPLSSWITKKIWLSLFCWLKLRAKAWYCPPGYFLAHFVEEIGEDNSKHHESDHPGYLWSNGPKAPSCPFHWDQLCSCPGWREVTHYPNVLVQKWGIAHEDLAPAGRCAAWAHHEWLSWCLFVTLVCVEEPERKLGLGEGWKTTMCMCQVDGELLRAACLLTPQKFM